MPSQLPTSFASAAAPNGVSDSASNGRNTLRGDGSGDWSRARTNGATQTFRRPSLASTSSHHRESSQTPNPPPSAGVYVPPHLNSNYQQNFPRNTSMMDSRFSKEQLLDLYRAQGDSGSLYKNPSEHLIEGWNPNTSSGASNGAWNRRDDHKDGSNGPEICWDYEGSIQPLGLMEFSEEEKEGGVLPGSRPGPRRRDTSDSLSFSNPLTSPTTANRLSKEEQQLSTPPPSLVRRRTDFKDSVSVFGSNSGDRTKASDRFENAPDTSSPFGSFKRTATGPLSAGLTGPSSPWSAVPQSAGFPSTGAFGSFSLGSGSVQPPTPGEKKPGYGSLRGESRFKGLMSQDSSEDNSTRSKDKASISNLEKLTEMESEQPATNWPSSRQTRQSTESNPFDEPEHRVGSAVLGGDMPSPPSQHPFLSNQADFQRPHDDIGFSAFNAASDMPSFRDMMQQRREYTQQQTPQGNQYAYTHHQEPMSPTNTNPYQSPEGEKMASEDFDTEGSEVMNMHQSTFSFGGNPTRPLNANFEGTASDRSQTSSAGPSRGFPNLGGLGGLGGMGTSGGWSAAPGNVSTPSRTNAAFGTGFGDSIFSSFGDTQSSSHVGIGAFGSTGSGHFGNVGTIGRGSKMGSLFPAAMQDQMRGNESSRQDHTFSDSRETGQGNAAKSTIGMNAPGFGIGSRESDSPSHQNRGIMDDLFGTLDGRGRGLQGLTSSLHMGDGNSNIFTQGPSFNPIQTPISATSSVAGLQSVLAPSSSSNLGRTPDADPSTGVSSQMPATQQRQMVMPDRMRWIYRDPQGNTQGPWSGLEMHDWYKAGFFSPELQVKKLEDSDYEPLAQLIRRIGNSREPFLVPQIGIPHGSASAQPSNISSLLGAVPTASPSTQTGSAQPPFASSFPSFGTTLTAEQQNALERRKQEEQYLMARQKEHLAQQQVMIKQMQHMQSGPHSIHAQQLHHHSSAHSLQSQPSYGSITSPTGYQPSPALGPMQQHAGGPGFFDPLARSSVLGIGPTGVVSDNLLPARESDLVAAMERLNAGRPSQLPFGSSSQNSGTQEGLNHQQQVMAMLQDRARLQREQDQFDLLQRASLGESQETINRLEQYKQLRAHEEDTMASSQDSRMDQALAHQRTDAENQTADEDFERAATFITAQESRPTMQSDLNSMSEQVSAFNKHVLPIQTQSPWATVDTGLPMPFPPPQSISPLPAPAAQRNRQNVADTLAAESRSRSQTPSIDTPNAVLAPWAKENLEGSKGPSLKEIQEAEARETAQQEEVATAARRAFAEQERQMQMQSTVPAPGLPSTANWASGNSPATPTAGGPSAWAKPLAGKQPASLPPSTAKKTLAQIQKEEEARKARVAAVAAANVVNNLAGTPTLLGGKRYADLAGKVASPISTGVGGAWTTVGAGGKLKTPIGAPAASTPVPRAPSGGSVTSTATATRPKPTIAPVRSATTGGSSSGQSANDELYKWAKGALGKGLNISINVDDFVRNILQLPSEPEILSEAVYANSPTLDGRRFAEEFIRRRKLADRGIIPDTPTSLGFSTSNGGESKSGGGWSEVAKKGPANGAKEEPASAFKVVATKKKGKK
ncbi:hypothetical protein MMC18_005468 [Xylographa bjoerkii]|nr:hypothetical protein [Xylographa bjoerkii]